MPWMAVPIRMMHRQKCGNRLAWPMITPHVDEFDERSRTRSGLLGIIGEFDRRLDAFRQAKL
jgi:hypothetical protein